MKAYGEYLIERGWRAGTNFHPRDRVARQQGTREVLCEVKTVGANAELAVRAVIGQLLTCRHMCYPPAERNVHLLGVGLSQERCNWPYGPVGQKGSR